MSAMAKFAATTLSSTVRPRNWGSLAFPWFRRLVLPSAHAAKEWRRWGRPLRSGMWPLWVALGILWAAPPGMLAMGECLSLEARTAEGLMWGSVSLLILSVSVYFVITWWRRPSTRSVVIEMLATPSSPYDYARSVIRPLQVLLFAACLPLLVLKPGADLLGWIMGRGFLRGEWTSLILAVNVLICTLLDMPLILLLAARCRDAFRTVCAILLVVVPCHLPSLIRFGDALGFPLPQESWTFLLDGALLGQLAFGTGVFFGLPRCVNSCAQGYVEGKR